MKNIFNSSVGIVGVFCVLTFPLSLLFIESKEPLLFVVVAEFVFLSIVITYNLVNYPKSKIALKSIKSYVLTSKIVGLVMILAGIMYFSCLGDLIKMPELYRIILGLSFYILLSSFLSLGIVIVLWPSLSEYLYGSTRQYGENWFDDIDAKDSGL